MLACVASATAGAYGHRRDSGRATRWPRLAGLPTSQHPMPARVTREMARGAAMLRLAVKLAGNPAASSDADNYALGEASFSARNLVDAQLYGFAFDYMCRV